MLRFLVILVVATVLTTLLWPSLHRLGVRRLPGDIVIERGRFRFYLPLMTSLLVGIAMNLVIGFVGGL